SERVFNVFYVFSHWLAAVWMFILARYLKLGRFASLLAAICFGLGGFVGGVGWSYMLNAMVWLPLVVVVVLPGFDFVRSSRRQFNSCVAGLALGMTFLAGGLHIAILDAIVVVTLAAYIFAQERRRNAALTAAAVVSTVAIVSILFGAVQLLPSLEYGSL